MTTYINVTHTFSTRGKRGVQRVVRQVVSRLVKRTDIVLIVWFKSGFHKLSLDEVNSLLAASLFEPQNKIKIDKLNKGDIFFDIDASWIDIYDINQLYQLLKYQGVILVKMHYDAIPVLFPQFSPNAVFSYTDNFSASLQYCDYWLCISQTVRAELLKIATTIDAGQPVVEVIPLGADFNQNGKTQNEELADIEYGKYILAVGTVEPRKNHKLLLDAFEKLQYEDQYLNLVIAGSCGWKNDEIVERIESHYLYNKRIFWLKNATDVEIALLYKNAFVTANFSHYEGYGLPVIESLNYGCVTLCASGTAMEEVASGAAYCVAADRDSVVNALQQLESSEVYAQYKHKAEHFVVPKWGDSAKEIARFLDSIQQAEDILYTPRQAVYISIRADALYRSLNSVIKNMSFISKVVILCSDKEFSTINKKLESLAIDISLIKESELGIAELPDDHQIRNTYLRRKLYAQHIIEPNFIAFDDDSIVIQQVNIADFLQRGKHQSYYYYQDGRDWLGAYPVPTSFDLGIWRTVRFLYNGGYDTRLYNSHMPQIINKKICNMILKRTSALGLDEWSSYFNIAKYLYPQFFQDKVYRTIAWPPDLESWLPTSQPENILFQNYYQKDTDLFLKAPKKITSVVDQWLAEFTEKKVIQDNIVPGKPEIMLSKEGLTFNASSIKCNKDAKIYIKLIVDVNNFQIKCHFDMYEIVYNDESLPRYLLITAHLFNQKAENHIKISLNLTNTGEVFELSIPMTIVDEIS